MQIAPDKVFRAVIAGSEDPRLDLRFHQVHGMLGFTFPKSRFLESSTSYLKQRIRFRGSEIRFFQSDRGSYDLWVLFGFGFVGSDAKLDCNSSQSRKLYQLRIGSYLYFCWLAKLPTLRRKITDTNNFHFLGFLQRCVCFVFQIRLAMIEMVFACSFSDC